MLQQLHHQNKNDRSKTEMIAERDIKSTKELRSFVEEMQRSHPVPDDCEWLLVIEGSEFFVYSAVEN